MKIKEIKKFCIKNGTILKHTLLRHGACYFSGSVNWSQIPPAMFHVNGLALPNLALAEHIAVPIAFLVPFLVAMLSEPNILRPLSIVSGHRAELQRVIIANNISRLKRSSQCSRGYDCLKMACQLASSISLNNKICKVVVKQHIVLTSFRPLSTPFFTILHI